MPDSKVPSGSLDGSLEIRILKLIYDEPATTASEMAKSLNVGLRTIYRALDMLKSKGKIERVGGKRYGHWIIKEDELNGER